jgi:hypothetical protein
MVIWDNKELLIGCHTNIQLRVTTAKYASKKNKKAC